MSFTFTNRFQNSLPHALWSHVCVTPVKNPKTLHLNLELLSSMCSNQTLPWNTILSGNTLLNDSKPYSTRYGGHQFGNWAHELGDGRAIFLGEIKNSKGEFAEIQLKGAGKTPYSRGGDGRAVLRSSLREYLCAEAMFHLNIPTTRSLSLTLTGENVIRDILYSGHPKAEPGAIVCRTAESFLRFGHFEILAACGEIQNLKQLLKFTIENYFPELLLKNQSAESDWQNEEWFNEIILNWYTSVIEKTALLVANWMGVGFVHGVLNTDNMSVLGLTIDYGPYGWLEKFEPNWTPNLTDAQGKRYCYQNQPEVAKWNLAALGNVLIVLKISQKEVEQRLNSFDKNFSFIFQKIMAKKLGFTNTSKVNSKEFKELYQSLFEWMLLAEIDFTNFFVCWQKIYSGTFMQNFISNPSQKLEILQSSDFYLSAKYFCYSLSALEKNLPLLVSIIEKTFSLTHSQNTSPKNALHMVETTNPSFILRNYLTYEAYTKQEENLQNIAEEFLSLAANLKEPFKKREPSNKFCQKSPNWAATTAGCSVLSCSS
jgi:serine/tyrosine/threonine adenylyltransferase